MKIDFRRGVFAAVVTALLAALTLTACGGGSTTASGQPATTGTSAAPSSQVLPVDTNPITNTSTVQALAIDSVTVENNVDPTTGKDVSDHLEIAIRNTGQTELTGFEVYYSFADTTAGVSEGYYLKLPDSFTIPPGSTRIAHFDNSGAPDHFPVNQFSLYHTSQNALDVTVEVSATDAAPQTAVVKKDAGGSETSD